MTKHESDGVTYSYPKIFKCKLCGARLSKEEFIDTECEDFNGQNE